jgi:threonine dehydrogenase-like Zn-dependent dehydrogenase
VNGFVDCGKCEACLDGQQNLCPHHSLLGIDVDGCLAEQVTLPWRCVFACPDALAMKLIPAVSEVSTALHGFRCAGSVAGRSVAVIGGGDIGTTAAVMAKLFGAGPIVVVEPAEEPRARVRRVLPDIEVRASADDLPAECDIAFEASNAASGIEDAIGCLRRNGRAIIFSALGETTLRFSALYSQWHTREIAIFASNAKTPADVRDSIDLLDRHAELRAAFDLEPVAMEAAPQVIAEFAAYKRRIPVCVFPTSGLDR